MTSQFLALPRRDVCIDLSASQGEIELWRHALGHGGINALPLPDRVVNGVRKLNPRLIRVFLQEHFDIYPSRGCFEWRKLDPYLEAIARTGARVVAAITIKPKVLFPHVDHSVWRPTDIAEWQKVIFELVKRYSVDRSIVTHWEIGNETDIGETGGSPYLIADPQDYADYYRMTIDPILRAFPAAKVGGPAACWVENEPLPGFVRICRETSTQLDFISWHHYHDDPKRHAEGVAKAKALLRDFPQPRPEMMVTEWSKSFDPVSVEDLAFHPRRAADAAACLLAFLDAGVDWSFYYHIWDQVFHPEPFRAFFSQQGIDGMIEHWNELPHRFGLFGVSEEVRPQYFVYQMLSRMGEEHIAAHSDDPDLHLLSSRGDGKLSTLIANFNLEESHDKIVTLRFRNLAPGRKQLTTYRIDSSQRWSPEDLELIPLEHREVHVERDFRCQVYAPADSVALVTLTDRP